MRTVRAAKALTAVGLSTMLFGALLVTAPGAAAARDGVTICHRTSSVTGPYQVNTVSYDGANGDLEAHGGNDHDEHLGDAFDFEADPDVKYPTPRNGDQWGDIIPPIPYGDGLFTDGLNWDDAGMAIYFGKTGGVLGVDAAVCAAPATTPDTYTATVVKENNADGLGDYGDDETAPTADADVPFEVVITNTGTGVLTVDGLSDDWDGLDEPVDLLGLGAGELVCTTPDDDDADTDDEAFPMAVDAEIPAGAVVTCRFTLDDYSPAAGGSVTNTVTLDTEEAADASDTSIVRTPRGGDCTSNCGPIVIPDPPEEASEPSSLTVTKAVTGDVPDDGWSFSFDNDVLGHFELTDEGSSTSDEVEAGSYTITEASSDDADLTSIECTGDGEVVDLEAGTVTVEVEEGDSITCTFTNDFAEVEPGVAKPKPTEQGPSVAPATDRGGVLGAQVVRSLPRTGSSSQTLATVGAMLILIGAVITLGSRRKLALER